MYLPLLFKEGLRCLVIGGGEVASRKIEILLDIPCSITVVAPEISDFAAKEVRKGSVSWMEREYVPGDCRGYHLIIAATPSREVNQLVSEEARDLGIPVNVVDDPALSTVIFPAVWRDEPLLIAVSTAGAAPFLAAEIRTLLGQYAKGMGRWTELAGRFREIVRKEVADSGERRKLYKKFLDAGQPDESETPPDSDRLDDWLLWLDGLRKKSINRLQ